MGTEYQSKELTFSPNSTMDEDLTSNWAQTAGCSRIGLTIGAASATHVGVVYVQVTDDPDGTYYSNVPLDNGGSGTWYWNSPYGSASALAPSSGSEFDVTLDLDISARYFRVFYDYTSGTGTLEAKYTLKG